jgi:hypothetical protein
MERTAHRFQLPFPALLHFPAPLWPGLPLRIRPVLLRPPAPRLRTRLVRCRRTTGPEIRAPPVGRDQAAELLKVVSFIKNEKKTTT